MSLGSALYWICWPILLGALATVAAQLRDRWHRVRGALRPQHTRFGFLVGLLLGFALLFPHQLTQPSDMRLLWDEAVVHSTSLAMHFGHSAQLPVMAVPGEPAPVPVAFAVDKRPPLFPFLVSLLHAARGPAEENAQLLNKALRQLLLFAVALALLFRGAPYPALAGGLFLLHASPILHWTGTSGGIDLLATLLLLWFLDQLGRFLAQKERGHTLRDFLLLLAPAAAAAYARYEVAAVVVPGLALALWALRKKKKLFRRAAACFAGFLAALFPLALLLKEASGSFVEASAGPLFAMGHVAANLPSLLEAFLVPGVGGPFLGGACVLGLACFAWAAAKKLLTPFAIALAAASLFQLLLVLGYFSGGALAAASARLYLLPSLALLLAPQLLFHAAPPKENRRRKRTEGAGPWVYLALCLLIGVGSHLAHEGPLFPPSPEHHARAELARAAEAIREKRRLVITNLHFHAISLGLPAVSPAWFLAHEEALRPAVGAKVLWLRTPADDPYGVAREAEAALEAKYRWLDESGTHEGSVRLLRPATPEEAAKEEAKERRKRGR